MNIVKEKFYINELAEGQKIDTCFLVKNKESRTKRDGGKFISLALADKTGVIPAMIWDNVETLNGLFEKDNIVDLKGSVQKYGSQLQITVSHISKIEGEYDLEHFLPVYQGDINQLKAELLGLINGIKDPDYGRLINSIFTSELISKLEKAPAAVNMHHGYLGGLLEHTVAVAKLAEHTGKFYSANKDLLVTAALLHDVGKIEELSVGGSISYSEEGRLLGHLAIADHFVASCIEKVKNFPKEKALLLRHALLSHHGELEWGSPKRPKTMEALILHHIDNLDAKIGMFNKVVASLNGEQGWTDGRNPFKRSLYSDGKNDFFIQETIDGI